MRENERPGFVPVPGRRDIRFAQRKGPGQHLRTGVRPVGNGLGLRCLLVARALSTPNPPSSRMSVPDPSRPSRATPGLEGGWMRAPLPWRCPKPDESAGPADEPGAGPEQQPTLDPGNVNRVSSTRGGDHMQPLRESRCAFSHVAYCPSRPQKSLSALSEGLDFLSLRGKICGGWPLAHALSGYGFPHLASPTSARPPRPPRLPWR